MHTKAVAIITKPNYSSTSRDFNILSKLAIHNPFANTDGTSIALSSGWLCQDGDNPAEEPQLPIQV
jgi:hypothetical protein